MPVALVGLAAWSAVLVLVAWDSELARTLVAAVALGAAGFAIYLVALQAFVIDAWCIWCMVNDLVLVPLLAILAIWRALRAGSLRTRGSRRQGAGQVIGTWRRMLDSMRSRISVRVSPVAVMPWLRRPITACAGSGSRAIRSATDSASSCVPQG